MTFLLQPSLNVMQIIFNRYSYCLNDGIFIQPLDLILERNK